MLLGKEGKSRVDQGVRQQVEVLVRLGYLFRTPQEHADIEQALRTARSAEIWEDAEDAEDLCMMNAGQQVGIRLAPSMLSFRDAVNLVEEGYPIVAKDSSGGSTVWWVIERARGRKLNATRFDNQSQGSVAQREMLAQQWGDARRCWVAQPTLHYRSEAGARGGASAHSAHAPAGHHGGTHQHPKPLNRLLSLLRLDLRDIATLVLFALVAGVTGLATPLAVESLVNTVAWGTYLQPLLVLSLLLLGFLAFGGFLRILQNVVAEVLQQRMFVRIVGDLSHRLALADRDALAGSNPAELSNRYFDIMTMQKATASLLLDGITIVLSTMIGLILLAFYHPFLLGFDLILLFSMTVVTYVLGRGGVKTAIEESIIKYRIGHWLQDVISYPTAFQLHGGTAYAIDRANRMTVEYLMARRQHFRVLVRQFAFALVLQALASTALLGVGGWLVIRGELTLGQLVASELVVTAIVGAFAKIGKTLESYYDLLAATGKVGHLMDVPCDPVPRAMQVGQGPAQLRWSNLPLTAAHGHDAASTVEIAAGSVVAITGKNASGKSWLLQVLAGIRHCDTGFAEIAGLDARESSMVSDGSLVGYAGAVEIFHGSLFENIRLGRGWISNADIRETLERVGLWEDALQLPAGGDTILQSGGYPLSHGQQARLMLARAIVAEPRVLLIDGVLDVLSPSERWMVWQRLIEPRDQWTILLVTHDERLIETCSRVVELDHPTDLKH